MIMVPIDQLASRLKQLPVDRGYVFFWNMTKLGYVPAGHVHCESIKAYLSSATLSCNAVSWQVTL